MNLDDIERHGAHRMGRKVVRVAVYYEDGGRAVVDTPAPTVVPADDRPLSPMEAAVSEVLQEMTTGDVLSYEDMALKAGYSNTGKLRAFVKSVTGFHRLIAVGRGWRKT